MDNYCSEANIDREVKFLYSDMVILLVSYSAIAYISYLAYFIYLMWDHHYLSVHRLDLQY